MIKKGEIRKIPCDIYRCGVVACCACSYYKIADYLKEYKFSQHAWDVLKDACENVLPMNEGCMVRMDGDCVILLKEPSAPVAIHESFHAADAILSSRGVELTGHGEAYAYMIEHIASKIIS